MQKTPTVLEMIDGLISIPSISSVRPEFDQANQPVIDQLANWLSATGYQVEIVPVPGQTGKANLVATLGSGPGGLVLAGHTDTVPYDEGRWNYDPFKMTKTNERLYGLGTADMKSFLAIAIEAASQFDPAQFKAPLILVATADEECSMSGARALVERKLPQARHAIIGEPTGLRPIRMHKGILMESIHLRGRSGHSSDPSLGNSALEGMQTVLNELTSWRNELQQKHTNALFDIPVPTLNLGHIHGGDNPNRICAECELHIDLRPLPGMDINELRSIMRERLSLALNDSGLELTVRSLFEGTPAMETPAESAIVQATESLTGYSATSVAFGTEGPYFNQMGMNSVVLGPGDIDQAHQPDEFLLIERIEPTITLLRKLIHKFCLQENSHVA